MRTFIWHLSFKSIHKKIPLKQTAIKFPLLTFFWFIAASFVFVIYSAASGSSTLIPMVSTSGATILTVLAFLVIAYFASISFALIPAQQTFKKTFVHGAQYARTIIPAFLVNVLILFLALTLPANWVNTNPLLTIGFIILISIPAVAFTRLHIITAAWLNK